MLKRMKEFLIILIIFTLQVNSFSQELLVNLTDGVILGRYMSSSAGRTIRAFMGIPYAAPPLNNLRFRAPQRVKSWKPIILSAQNEPNKCPQLTPFVDSPKYEGNEDCLYLNVYTPEVRGDKGEYPVIIYFHGGNFLSSSGGISEFGPNYFLDTDVILVIGNYRLGVLGFLSTEDENSPGNYGLKDQVAILKWVNENIEEFGGNKHLVTIFGESVGGASVNYHMISPLSQNLFHRGISQSGTLQNFWADPDFKGEAKKKAKKLAEYLNCSDIEDSKIMVECFREATAEELIFSHVNLFSEYTDVGMPPFIPVMENLTQMIEEPFISIEKYQYNNIAKKIPWLVGLNSEEGAMVVAFLYSDDGVQMTEWIGKLPKFLGYDHLNEKDQEEITAAIREFYFNNEEISHSKLDNITNLFTDGGGYFGMFDVLESRFKDNNLENTFIYLYSHKGASSYTEFIGRQNFIGTSHMDELLNQFPLYETKDFYSSIPTDFDRALQKMIPNLWTNFATTGNPNLGHVNPFTHSNQFWPSASKFPLDYMRIGNDNGKARTLLEVKRDLFPERVEFWRKLKSKYPIVKWKF